MPAALNQKNLRESCRVLARADVGLARIFETCGTPPLWKRRAGFATLVHIILEQQVSLASALAAFNKLRETIGDVTPENVLRLSDAELKTAYFSRQKIVYVRDLANRIVEKRLDLNKLKNLPDAEAKDALKQVKGIGDWTADIYLLMALLRPDVMPKGDLALHIAWKKLKNLERAPTSEEFQIIAERWRPHRATAARLLWHYYLSDKQNRRSGKML